MTVGEKRLRYVSSFSPCPFLHKVTKGPQVSSQPRVQSGAPLGPLIGPQPAFTPSHSVSSPVPLLSARGSLCPNRPVSFQHPSSACASGLPQPAREGHSSPTLLEHPCPHPLTELCYVCCEAKLFSPCTHSLRKRPRFPGTG